MSINKRLVWLPYDFDTAIGINNEGELVFDYRLEDIDQTAGNEDIFNGQQSVIWKNIRAAFFDELKSMYQTLRSTGTLSYSKVEQMFEEHQGKWGEAIFNEDAQFKYLDPLIQDGVETYLGMLQGSKAEQRKWWLYNRFRYIDSKYNAGDSLSDTITLRPYAADDITITPYADIYATVAWDANLTQERAERGAPVTLECPYQSMNDNVVTIFSASQLASIGDISGLKVGLADFSNATRLQSIKIGDSDSGYNNQNLRSLTLGNNILLQSLDARNCSGLGDTSMQGHNQTTVDISGCSIIEHVYFDGTKITGLTLPVGGILKTLKLPDTITNLTVRNHSGITTFSVENDDYSAITTLRIENCGSGIPVLDILADMAENSRVRIIGFTMTVSSTADVEDFYDSLDTMRGLDESGNNTNEAVAAGTITGLGTITGAWLAEMRARYPNITIQYQHISSYVYYYNYDGSQLLYTETVVDGGNAAYSGTPARASTAQYAYAFAGWNTSTDQQSATAGCLNNVTEDVTVYAAYSRTLRTYTVIWKNADDTVLETDTGVAYGTVPTYDGATPTYSGQTSTGWSPAVAAITGDTTYTATYLPVYTATFVRAAEDGGGTLYTVQVQEGSTPVYGGTTPTTTQGSSTDFTFTGWSPALGAIYANTTYTAVFRDNRSATVQYLSRNITSYESETNTKLGTYSLYGAAALTSVETPATTVEDYALGNCTALETVELSGTSAATIAANAFNGCSSLTAVIIRSTTKSTLSNVSAFAGTPIMAGFGAIYVPSALVSTYKQDSVWSAFNILSDNDYPAADFSTISDTWAQIIANSNYATDYAVGDTKLLELSSGEKLYMQLVALDTDVKADDTGNARMTWISKGLMATTQKMNSSNTTSGGWESCALRTYLSGTVKPLLPETVRNAIVPVKKYSSTYSSAIVVDGQNTTDELWIPSNQEVAGGTTYETSGTHYSTIFSSDAKRTKYLPSGAAYVWWLRSAFGSTTFRFVSNGGGVSSSSASSAYGVALGFCI